MITQSAQERADEKKKIEMENAHLVRDLLAAKDGKMLWDLVSGLLRAREAIALLDMQNATKRIPMYNDDNQVTGYLPQPYEITDFYTMKGLIDGLRWLSEEINRMRRLAMEDEEEAGEVH